MTIQTALELYLYEYGALPQPTRDGELNANSSENPNGLIGKYLVKPISYLYGPYCYGYSTNRKRGFVAAWLDVEDVLFVRAVDPPDFSDDDAKLLLRGATSDNFNWIGSCPVSPGYTVVRIQAVP